MFMRGFRFLFVFCSLAITSNAALGSQNGLSGYSSSPHTNNGSSCLACHTQNVNESATLVLEGPSVVEANQTYEYTLRLMGGAAKTAGVNISVDHHDGDLQTRDGSLKKLIDDLTHSRPKLFINGEAIFSFRWKAPSYNATTAIYAAANSSDGKLDLVGDSIATTNLQVRVQNGTGTRPQNPDPEISSVRVRRIARGMTNAVSMANAGDSRLFVVRQPGIINVIKNGAVLPQPFLDIQSQVTYNRGEQGLLGLAFHPAYASNGYFFVHYMRPYGSAWRTRISRFRVSGNPDVANRSSETVIMEYDQPSAFHNGGDLKFGNDGYLYISSGESGRRPESQSGGSLLGKILRIDVTNPPGANNQPDCGLGAGSRYRIPPGNAYANGRGNGCDEIYLMGLRNPWRISFDRQTGDLWIGEVGFQSAEEINFIKAGTSGGLNLGWPCYEGYARNRAVAGCDGQYVAPIHTYYGDGVGKSVTGGFVYRGNRYPALRGRYFFSDYNYSKVINTLTRGPNGWVKQKVWTGNELSGVSSFGEGADGELYVLTHGAGEVYAIEAAGGSGETPRLSVSSVAVTEGINDRARINVRLSRAATSPVSVTLETVAGTAKSPGDFGQVSQRLTFTPGQTNKSVDIDIVDDGIVEPEESFDVRLSAVSGAIIGTGTASVRINDDDTEDDGEDDTEDGPVPVLSVTDARVTEGSDSTARVRLSLSEAATSTVSVNVMTVEGSATAPEDYTGVVRRVSFSAGETSKTFDVQIRDDRSSESVETFEVALRQAAGVTLGRSVASVTITDDDAAAPTRPTVSVSGATVKEGVDSNAIVNVRLSAPSTETVSVTIYTVPGSAMGGSDYTGFSRRLTFNPGDTTQDVEIRLLNDGARESTENLSVRLSRPTGATIGTGSAIVTINDDDDGTQEDDEDDTDVRLGLSGQVSAVTEGVDAQARLTLRLTAPAQSPVQVALESQSGTATEGADYVGVNTTLTFNPGERQHDVDIAIVDDDINEPIEQFVLRIRAVQGTTVQTPSLSVVINDDDSDSVDQDRVRLKKALRYKVDNLTRRLTRLGTTNFRNNDSRRKLMNIFWSLRNTSRTSSPVVANRFANRFHVRVNGCGQRPDSNDYIVKCVQQRQIRKLNNEIRGILRQLMDL